MLTENQKLFVMDKEIRTCAIFNIAPLYRQAIFRLMDKELGVCFMVGDHSSEGIALMKAETLTGFVGYLRNKYRGTKLVWQKGALWRVIFGPRYDCYIMTGNAGIRSNWLIALWTKIARSRKVILWSHGLHGDESRMTLYKNLLYFRIADSILLYGNQGRRLLLEHGVAESKLHVVYNSLDYDDQLVIRNKMGDNSFIRNYFGADLPLISYIGRLTASKKLEQLLLAIVPLKCNLIILGDGAQRARLEALCAELGLVDRVWFYGECYDQALTGSVLYHSVVSVSPSSIGLMAIHSLMMGTPVITHDNMLTQAPECEAVVQGVTGDFFHENSVEDLGVVITKYLSLTAEQRETYRQQCYREVDGHWNPRSQIETIKKAIGILFER